MKVGDIMGKIQCKKEGERKKKSIGLLTNGSFKRKARRSKSPEKEIGAKLG